MFSRFDVRGGTIGGREHAIAGRNNQDAYGWRAGDHGLVAVVCDGCGSGAHNEVGAKVGAALIPQALLALLPSDEPPHALLQRAYRRVIDSLHRIACDMSGADAGAGATALLRRTVQDYWLFTVVGLFVTKESLTLFSRGDGLIVMDGDRLPLGPFPNNEPPYLGYDLLGEVANRSLQCPSGFALHRTVPLHEIGFVLLGTDGVLDLEAMADRSLHDRPGRVGPLSQFWAEPCVFRNVDGIRRRLTVIHRGPHGGVLPDDTTVVVVRHRRGEEGASP